MGKSLSEHLCLSTYRPLALRADLASDEDMHHASIPSTLKPISLANCAPVKFLKAGICVFCIDSFRWFVSAQKKNAYREGDLAQEELIRRAGFSISGESSASVQMVSSG